MKNLQSTVEGVWRSLDETELTDNDIIIANEAYAKNKPTVTDDDVYQLIGVDVSINGEMANGIINYRINEEHDQVRF